MKIFVCMKQVPETQNVQLNKDTHTLVRENIKMTQNPADMAALETAVSLKKLHGGTVCAITMGTKQAASVLSYAATCGADELYLLSDKAFAGSDSYATAFVLSRAIRVLGGADLILCGRRAVDGETGQVGPEMSVMLDLPCLTNVVDLESRGDGMILCRRLVEDGYEKASLTMPALISVCEGKTPVRAPSIADLRRAKGITVTTLDHQQLAIDPSRVGLSGSPTRVRRTFSPITGDRKCMIFEDCAAGAQASAEKISEVLSK